jgi:ABC-2 type transport system ATP-binding protein
MPPRYAIEMIDVTKRFGDKWALNGITFTMPTGKVVGLLGPNGSGKTTSINILATLMKPSGGQARVAGFDVVKQGHEVRKSIGLTGQYAAVDELLTGYENLVLFGQLRGMTGPRAQLRADELLAAFSLTEAGGRRVSEYSGGMRRRIDIACGLVVSPQVVFLDEPTTGLDPRSRHDVWSLVSGLTREGISVLLTTQYLEEADALADRIVVIDAGSVIADGTADDLKSAVGASYCQVTPLNRSDLPYIVAALDGLPGVEIDPEAGSVSIPAPYGLDTLGEVFRRIQPLRLEISDISLRKPSLDEVFLSLTGQAASARRVNA